MMLDLREEVEGLFAEAQDGYVDQQARVFLRERGTAPGFHVITPHQNVGKSRNEYMRKYDAKRAYEDIKRRLLAGERPAAQGTKKGARPKRWIRAAKELGIVLESYNGMEKAS